jgi:hypothetical protein
MQLVYSDWLWAASSTHCSLSPSRVNTFFLLHSVQTSLLSNGYCEIYFRGVKRLGREADHSPPISAKVNKVALYIHSPHMSSWSSA